MNRSSGRIALTFILLVVAGACGSDEPSASTSVITPASTTTGSSVSVATSSDASSPATSAETVETTPPAAACTTDALLPTVADLFPDNPRWNIVDIQIAECRGGYVRLFAVADQSICTSDVPQCLENEQVFLEDVSGAWTYLDSGSGLSCTDTQSMSRAIVPACAVLEAS
jgi:hypothetical protein